MDSASDDPFLDYELLDFGDGRKLERFGNVRLDRPSPAADGTPRHKDLWSSANARFEGAMGRRGTWTQLRPVPDEWSIAYGSLTFQLRLGEFGHIGIFPEQVENWRWLAQQLPGRGRPLQVLNLFAYTGASSLVAAAAGAEVVHVDASRSTVAWARRNAEASQLSAAPIRWIVDDALKFIEREMNRDRQYDAVVLDPPSYGHGAGKVWKLDRDLPELLEACAALTMMEPIFMLLTCHSPGYGPDMLASLWREWFPRRTIEADHLYLTAADGRRLHCGAMARLGRTPS